MGARLQTVKMIGSHTDSVESTSVRPGELSEKKMRSTRRALPSASLSAATSPPAFTWHDQENALVSVFMACTFLEPVSTLQKIMLYMSP